jgi:integrase/recombinase XerD
MNRQALDRHLEAYLCLREALGLRMEAERVLLPKLIDFVIAQGGDGPIRAQLVVDWARAYSPRRGGAGAVNRLSIARQFLRYLHAIEPGIEIPPPGIISRERRPKPFLFSPSQIAQLLDAARHAQPRNSLRPHTLVTLLGLLASTGLRVREALRLTVDDVKLDHAPAFLQIRETKFQKSRLVPLHASAVEQLKNYIERRAAVRYDALSETLLLSTRGRPVNYSALQRWFRNSCRRLRIEPADDTARHPCLHSFRHGFAVDRLRHWYETGRDVRELLPELAVYLGHVRPEETYWYLTATPELLTAAAERFQRFADIGETP